MPRETNAAKRARAIEVCERLNRRYGPVECFLDHESPYRLVISVLLSAQTTDAQVNRVAPELFRRWPTPATLAQATPEEVGEVIHSLALSQDPCRGATQDRAGPAQDLAARVLARCQPPVDQVLPRDLQREES